MINDLDHEFPEDVVSLEYDAIDRVPLPVPPPNQNDDTSAVQKREAAAWISRKDSPAPFPSAAEISDLEIEVRARVQHHYEKLQRRRKRLEFDSMWREFSVRNARYCVIDLETTGPHPMYPDEILEIGMVHVEVRDGNMEVGKVFSSFVNPMRPISSGAFRVHGIRTEQVLDSPQIRELLPHVDEWCDRRILVFHNAGFDLGFLHRAFAEEARELLTNPVLDTLVLARRIVGGPCGLGRLAHRLGLAGEHPHRALGDARLTALLLGRLLQFLQEGHVDRLEDVPGCGLRPPRTRTRRRARRRFLQTRLARAIDANETLHVAYRVNGLSTALQVKVRPYKLEAGSYLLARDSDLNESLTIELASIETLETADALTTGSAGISCS